LARLFPREQPFHHRSTMSFGATGAMVASDENQERVL
jgi:hypothetical protein